jgi:hypothetical protein
MVAILSAVVSIFAFRIRGRASLEIELIALRHQVTVLRRQHPSRPQLSSLDRLLWVWLYRIWPQVIDAMVLVRWHRAGFRAYWHWRSRPHGGRPKTAADIRQLIRGMSVANPLWGAPRMGIRDRPISPRSPWQNGYSERLIGSIRRDCLDHVVVFGERHLRHLLNSYQKYYNEARTHLSLHKDAPIPRPVQTVGRTLAMPVLGGLHHQYFRV